MKPVYIFDSETLKNYYLASFKDLATGKVLEFELFEGKAFQSAAVRALLDRATIVTFNGNGFDMPILALALDGASAEKIKNVANKIIATNIRPWQMGLDPPRADHIDLFEVAPGMVSLKMYGARMHMRRLQDLPYAHDVKVTPEMREVIRRYCINDLDTTIELYKTLKPQIDLRAQMSEQYGVDLRSKSDAQIAEAVIKHEVEKRSGVKIQKHDPLVFADKSFRYVAPKWIAYKTPVMKQTLREIESLDFVVGPSGGMKLPVELGKKIIDIDGRKYKMGIGGLHSQETNQAVIESAGLKIYDHDVTSYYPSLILNCGLSPASLGKHFLPVYRSIVERRVLAKRNKDTVTADVLKIVANGTFGKLGSPYSCLYAPDLMIQVTITGQLSLLMLIEMMVLDGFGVVSANTDGIVVCASTEREPRMREIMANWEKATGLGLETAQYKALYSRDVNNYVAVKPDGKLKRKGIFAPISLAKSPQYEIVPEAVCAFIRDGVPVEKTISSCREMKMFTSVRKVTGGAKFVGEQLGKTVRWYKSVLSNSAIKNVLNNYQVAGTENCMPLMELPDEFFDDVDLDWYINEANETLMDIGAIRDTRIKRGAKARAASEAERVDAPKGPVGRKTRGTGQSALPA